MLQAVHLPSDYLSKSQQLAPALNCSSVLLSLKSFRMQSAHPHSKPCGLQAPEPSNHFTSRLRIFFLILLFREKNPSNIPSIYNTQLCLSLPQKHLECENINSRLGQIHTNVTVNVQNIMCHCFSPPTPNKLLKTHFIHKVTVLAVYLINMTTQSTQDFFQFPSFAFSHFGQKEQKVTTVLYFFCQYTVIYIS